MSRQWLDRLPARIKRVSFWLTVAILGNVVVWLVELNHKAYFRADAPHSLFGVRIGSRFSRILLFWEVAGILFFGMMLLAVCLFGLGRWLARPTPAGLCRVCGYDLRATPGRCPECGRVPDAAADRPGDRRPVARQRRPRRGLTR